jgi:succinyl-CoA synthetase alpha subunit
LNKLVLTQLLFLYHLLSAADAIMEAADAGIKVIIAITEGILADMIKANAYVKKETQD